MEDEPKITTKVKNPKRVEQGRRLAAIAKEAKARKAAERKKVEEEFIENSNLLYVTVGVIGVTGLGYGVYNFLCKQEQQQQQQQQEQEQPQPQQQQPQQQEKQPEKKSNFDDS